MPRALAEHIKLRWLTDTATQLTDDATGVTETAMVAARCSTFLLVDTFVDAPTMLIFCHDIGKLVPCVMRPMVKL